MANLHIVLMQHGDTKCIKLFALRMIEREEPSWVVAGLVFDMNVESSGVRCTERQLIN